MSPSADDTNGPRFPASEDSEELHISIPSENVYVFHTNNENEFIRIDLVVDLEEYR